MPELLLSCQDLTKAFGANPLFEGLSFSIAEGDHIGVVGPNGAGKTTLLRILTGDEDPTSGTRTVRRMLRVGYVPQDPRFPVGATVASVLGTAAADPVIDQYETDGRVAAAMRMAALVDGEQPVSALSGGWLKRLAIARALVGEPELLLLDEPTNHLDLDGIFWLEDLLQRVPLAFLAVSHDRYFLEAIATRVIEINRAFASGLLDAKGRYSDYLEKKDVQLAGQAAYQESLRNRVRGELEWLSRKARARTRKAKARIDEAGRLRGELADLDARARLAAVDVDFTGTERRTRRLLVARGLTKSYGARTVLRDVPLALAPGTRLGLVGANGSGKTTLLRLLAGLEAPDSGSITRALDLRVVTFDQKRERIDPGLTLRRALAPAGDSVVFNGMSIHVAGWAKRFLFLPEQLEMPLGRFSGGEQARVLIARLMLEPADLLLLDEPTNDLDIPTLEVLEESLLEFAGALVLVTHDRHLLERVSTTLLALDGQGSATAYADYAQWELAREAAETVSDGPGAESPASRAPLPDAATKRSRTAGSPGRLGYLEQREWEAIESRIEEAERELAARRASAADPAIASDHAALTERLAALAPAQAAVDRLYARWAELEAKLRTTTR
jgi:ATP-binding cassette subfamily F protein uup